MSEPIEDTSLFKIKNYSVHPTQKNYYVFYYSDHDMSDTFEKLLIQNDIEYEKDKSDDLVKRSLFGIHKKYINQCLRLNNIAIGRHRHPFIKEPILRYTIIILSIGIILLAIFSYFQNGA